MLRLIPLCLFLSPAASAVTVTDIQLILGGLTGSGSSLTTPAPAFSNGWTYQGSLLVNQTIGATFNGPLEVRLTDTQITCMTGCTAPAVIPFWATVSFSQAFEAGVPYSVSIAGTGPAGNVAWFFPGAAGFQIFSGTGNFSYSTSGAAATPAGNVLMISGVFRTATAGTTGSTVLLPDSFDLTAAPVFVPEPATAGLAGLAMALVAWAARRR